MALLFQLRADNASFQSRITPGLKTPVIPASGSNATYEADVSALNANRYNFDRTSTAYRPHMHRFSALSANRARSLHVRIKFITGGIATGIAELSAGDRLAYRFGLATTTTQLTTIISSGASATLLFNNAAWAPSTGVWYDVVFVWDGVTTTNGVVVYIDAVALATLSPSAGWETPFPAGNHNLLTLGIAASQASARWCIEEVNVWDEVIDPTAVALVSGTGALDGAARTSLVAGTAFEGGAQSDPGIANVKSGTGYTINGVSLTGTYAPPAGKGNLGNKRLG